MKRLLSMILSVVLVASVLTTGVFADEIKLISAKPEISFSDVDKDSTSGKAIYKLANAGILVGDGDGTFRPEAPIKRSELCKIVNTIFGYTEKDTTGFSDVTPANWYYDHVLIAKKAGYIVGFDDGTFKGENYVTREQSCAILCRVAKLFDISDDVEIKDAVSGWAMPYVQTVIGNKLMSLEEGNTFRAQENIKRDEYSVVYANFVQEKPAESDKPVSSGNAPSGGGNTPSGGGNAPSGGGNAPSGGTPSTPGTPDTPEKDYATINAVMLANLQKVMDDIDAKIDKFTTDESVLMLETIYKCIEKVKKDGSSHEINRKYLTTHYGGEKGDITIAKGYFDEIKADPVLRGKFNSEIGYLNGSTLEWLLEAFGIEMEDLGI